MSQVTTFTPDQITAAVKALVVAGKTLSRKVEQVLVMAVFDSIVNKSPVVANALINALRTSMKRDGIIAFLEKFGQLHNKGGKTGFVHFNLGSAARLEWDADYVAQVQEEAMGWEGYKPEPKAAEAMDVMKAVQALIAKTEKDGVELIDGDLVPYLKALLAQYAGKKAIAAAGAAVKGDIVVNINRVPVAA